MAGGANLQGPKILSIMGGIERAITDGKRETVTKAAMAAKVIHAIEIDRASGGDSVLSGVGLKGAKVGVRYDVSGGGFDPEALLKATGPLHFVENDTSPHLIRSRYMTGGRSRRSNLDLAGASFKRRKVVGPTQQPVINLGPLIGHRRWARHPGTKGVHPWEKGRKRAEPAIRKIMRTSTFNIIKKAARP